MKPKYKPENDMTIEELCKESKKQRKEDRRKGELRAIRNIRRWVESDYLCNDEHSVDIADVFEKLNRMEQK